MYKISDSLINIEGIGPKKYKNLNKLNLFTVKDILHYYPKSYEDLTKLKKIVDIVDDEEITVFCQVYDYCTEIKTRNNKHILKIPVKDDTGKCYIIFYNSPYLKNIFLKNEKFYFFGKVKIINSEKQILHPKFFKYNDSKNILRINPIYPLTKGITQNDMVKIQEKIILNPNFKIEEYLPKKILHEYKLCTIDYAIRNIHFPKSKRALQVAKYRLIFEELLFMQIGLLMLKYRKNKKGISYKVPAKFFNLIEELPFKLTNSQNRTLKEIIQDMSSNNIMNRLVQGDVGSGKTIIGLLSIYLAVLNGYQAALMAPTEILAEQHFMTFKKHLSSYNVNIELLTSNTKNKETILAKLYNGEIDVLIGTHALIEDKVIFKNLGLVITDEQHRFGVRQRNFLNNKGLAPDVIVMTATPIPRTLSLVLYGDLDISTIDELPPGRKSIKTYSLSNKEKYKMLKFIEKELDKGRQAYFVCPLIEDSDNIKCQSAINLYNELKKLYFNRYSIGLIHGKLNNKDKNIIMNNFKDGLIQILVTTSVIEVGINVPNATIMVIQNAERFGLAQLHQLRGRVGRGNHQSFCFLITDSKNEITKKRMKIMEDTCNGFIIAEKDLELRGPGDFFGTKQHGLPELKIANLFLHTDILKLTQNLALDIIHTKLISPSEEYKVMINRLRDYFKIPLDSFTL